jgi:hypothetical protein
LWQAYLCVEGDGYYQEFCVCSNKATKAEANYFARMLAKALDRLLQMETKRPNKEIKTKMPNTTQGDTHAATR